MIWIPFWAAGVINGLGHWVGYKNGTTRDNSHNLVPWGIIIGGEELHNNHHLSPARSKLSVKPWEFDIGWMYINILKFFRLVKVR
jgi:fatty-acid desaturase